MSGRLRCGFVREAQVDGGPLLVCMLNDGHAMGHFMVPVATEVEADRRYAALQSTSPNESTQPLRAPGRQGEEEECDCELSGVPKEVLAVEGALWALAKHGDRKDVLLVGKHIRDLRSHLSATLQQLAEARKRVRLLDDVIGEHHSASVMREENDVCPVCTEHGGVDFFSENARIYRALEPWERRIRELAARQASIPRPPDGTTGGITDEPHDRE